MTKEIDALIQKVNVRIPASVSPSTRIVIHPCEWIALVAEIERLDLREAKARAILEPMAECDPQIREWLKCQS